MNNLAFSAESCFLLLIRHKELESPFKHEIEAVVSKIRHALQSNSDLDGAIEGLFSDVFKFRMLAFQAILDEGEDLTELMVESYPFFEEMTKEEATEILGENILFAIRSNQRLVNQLFSGNKISSELIEGKISNADILDSLKLLQGVDFNQFIGLIKMNAPDGLSAPIAEWMECSLKIEFVILAGALIKEKTAIASKQIIDELSFIIADATQTYNALAIESGVLSIPDRICEADVSKDLPEDFFLNDQKKISEAGLSSFSENWN